MVKMGDSASPYGCQMFLIEILFLILVGILAYHGIPNHFLNLYIQSSTAIRCYPMASQWPFHSTLSPCHGRTSWMVQRTPSSVSSVLVSGKAFFKWLFIIKLPCLKPFLMNSLYNQNPKWSQTVYICVLIAYRGY